MSWWIASVSSTFSTKLGFSRALDFVHYRKDLWCPNSQKVRSILNSIFSFPTTKLCVVFYYSSGQDIQKVNAVDNVITLLEETQPETLHRVVPALQEAIRNGSQDLHLASAKMLASIAEKEILPGYLYAKSFLPIILENLNNIKVGKHILYIIHYFLICNDQT